MMMILMMNVMMTIRMIMMMIMMIKKVVDDDCGDDGDDEPLNQKTKPQTLHRFSGPYRYLEFGVFPQTGNRRSRNFGCVRCVRGGNSGVV